MMRYDDYMNQLKDELESEREIAENGDDLEERLQAAPELKNGLRACKRLDRLKT